MYTSIVPVLVAISSLVGDVGAAPASKRQTVTQILNNTMLSRPNVQYNKTQLADIKTAMTEVDRVEMIRSWGNTDEYFKFDFSPVVQSGGNAGNGQGGQGILAAVQNYPILLNTGLSMAMVFLEPCGLDSMHIHNRATEMVVLVAGGPLKTSFVMEDGSTDPVQATIGLYQGVVRPQGSVHWEFNDKCAPAVFVSGLSNEDPGVSRTAQTFFVNPGDLVDADMGYPEFLNGVDMKKYYQSLPRAFALGAQECLTRCGLKYVPTRLEVQIMIPPARQGVMRVGRSQRSGMKGR